MGLVLTRSSPLHCAHGGAATASAGPVRVYVGGAPALGLTSVIGVSGCPAAQTTDPRPTGTQHQVVAAFCVHGIPATFATRVTSGGVPLLLQESMILAVPSGMPVIAAPSQARVTAR